MDLTLTGRVTKPDGTAAAAVAVSIRSAPASVPDLSVLTDGSGRFSLSGLPAGEYRLFLMPPDGAGVEITTVLDGSVATHAFRLPTK